METKYINEINELKSKVSQLEKDNEDKTKSLENMRTKLEVHRRKINDLVKNLRKGGMRV